MNDIQRRTRRASETVSSKAFPIKLKKQVELSMDQYLRYARNRDKDLTRIAESVVKDVVKEAGYLKY